MAKKKIAMFLGAGASKAFQYPLTREILNLIIESICSSKLFSDAGIPKQRSNLYRLMLKKLLISLSPGLAQVFEQRPADNEDLPMITDLLSQAEHLVNNSEALLDWNYEIKHPLLGYPKGMNERWELKDVIALLDWAIIYVINKEGKYTKDKLQSFINWVRKINTSGNSFVSIITTNFDFAVEWNLLTESERDNAHKFVDYGFNWRDVGDSGTVYLRPPNPRFRFFKLHGSIDWLKCERCGFIYINPVIDIYDLAFLTEKSHATECHCGYWPLKPVLVTPSFSRSVRDTNLSQIWRNTVEEFRLADEWIIAGYSMPGEDLNIKSLFLRALEGRDTPPVIKVIQLNIKSKPRFDYFFGKDRYEFIEGGFENYDFNKILKPKALPKKQSKG